MDCNICTMLRRVSLSWESNRRPSARPSVTVRTTSCPKVCVSLHHESLNYTSASNQPCTETTSYGDSGHRRQWSLWLDILNHVTFPADNDNKLGWKRHGRTEELLTQWPSGMMDNTQACSHEGNYCLEWLRKFFTRFKPVQMFKSELYIEGI